MDQTIEQSIIDFILSVTGARSILSKTLIQSLWSDYGQIVRLELDLKQSKPSSDDDTKSLKSVILKHIKLPEKGEHPRGWNTNLSHQRKVRSYQVEAYWYQYYAKHCNTDCAVPTCLAVKVGETETVLVLTDLDSLGFSERKQTVESRDIKACLKWLANFHVTFLGAQSDGLWENGTYWHLATRPDELSALADKPLKQAAPLIDQKLAQCQFQTLVHGDAKLANFCFAPPAMANSSTLPKVAAVDFQYVGQGCGMKDVVYLLGSCLYEDECEAMESELLDCYFSELSKQVVLKKHKIDPRDLENEWRTMYSVAWADFHRFIKGWSPGHWKINSYSEKLTAQVIKELELEK